LWKYELVILLPVEIGAVAARDWSEKLRDTAPSQNEKSDGFDIPFMAMEFPVVSSELTGAGILNRDDRVARITDDSASEIGLGLQVRGALNMREACRLGMC
jgi:hypothetical protein